MKTYRSGHGPVAVMSRPEQDTLEVAHSILEEARQIESDQGQLHVRNYPEVAAAEAALIVVIDYQLGLDRKVTERAE